MARLRGQQAALQPPSLSSGPALLSPTGTRALDTRGVTPPVSPSPGWRCEGSSVPVAQQRHIGDPPALHTHLQLPTAVRPLRFPKC